MALRRKLTIGVPKEEKRLVSALRSALLGGTGLRHSKTFRSEVDCFQGVADLVVGHHNGYHLFPQSAPSRLVRSLSFSTAKVLSMLRGRKRSKVSEISHYANLTTSTVRKQLRLLQALGIVNLGRDGAVTVVHEIRQPFETIDAYEVKVKDWKGGLYQAQNYKAFANRATLALPLSRALRLRKHIPVFQRFRIGLLGVGKDGDLVWLSKPRRAKPISPARNFLASTLLLRKTATRS